MVEAFFGHIDRISDDNNLENTTSIRSLVDTAPNGEEFHFSTSNMNCVMEGPSDRVIVSVYM